MGRDREREPDLHAARVALHGRVEEPLDLGERDDLVELARHLGLAHAEDRGIQVHVLAAGQLRVETGSHFEQAADAAEDRRAPARRPGDPREDLQQRRLAGAVPADDPDGLAGGDLEGDVLERPQELVAARPAAAEAAGREPREGDERVAQCLVRLALADPVPLRDPGGLDCGPAAHTTSAKSRSVARK